MGGWITLLDVVTALGQVMLNLSLTPDMYKIHQCRSTGELSALPLVSMLVNCHIWTLYGILRNSIFPVAVSQGFGELVALVCNMVYFRWSTKNQRQGLLKMYALAFPIYGVATLFFVLSEANVTNQSHYDASTALGYAGVVINVIMFASPLARLKRVIETKSAASIPINLSLMMFISSVLWVATGLLDSDYFIFGLNAAGVVLGALQILLYYFYRPKKSEGGVLDDESGRVHSGTSTTTDPVKAYNSTAVLSPEYKSMPSPIVITTV